ncbi:MAG: tRNA uridine-5-carboxymethylaminomethyl(34) synthesis GTPase MnmE [Acidobacteriota bacterium]|nr:tRNA uridine-5-carboxymethylaminomethyl(34) synthesis GTPase MnmE [Acidobacteriota bacterium]
MNLDDTIVAIATPPGRGGIGVVRLAGADARSVALPMLRLAHGHDLEAGRAHFGELIDPASGERLDEVVVSFFAKPHSYTTDDVVEISCHGSPVVLRHVVQMALAGGARLAEPGEFTMRAFLNGRIDLTQAEAVRDLIESQTLYQAQVAAHQLEGALSRRLQPTKQKLVELISMLEAGVDFAEDDVSVLLDEQILSRIAAIRAPLQELLSSFAFGKLVHEGLTLAIVGRPNVGKSSLFNRLVERERAIVTATPGTTRDLVSETVSIGGIPVRLVDTAGIRAALDEAESIGVRKSMEAVADADIVLVVLDVSEFAGSDFTPDGELLEKTQGRPRIVVGNKCDLLSANRGWIAGKVPEDESATPVVFTSAVTGEGIDQLRAMVLAKVHGDSGSEREGGFLTNVRHQKLVDDAIRALDKAIAAIPLKTPHEMLLLDLYSALRPLDDITGATTADDILNLIFSSFCIGK